MSKKRAPKTNDYGVTDASPWEQLDTLSAQLRGIGYLIECQRDCSQPTDIEDVYYGIGVLISVLASEVRTVGRKLDELDAKSRGPK